MEGDTAVGAVEGGDISAEGDAAVGAVAGGGITAEGGAAGGDTTAGGGAGGDDTVEGAPVGGDATAGRAITAGEVGAALGALPTGGTVAAGGTESGGLRMRAGMSFFRPRNSLSSSFMTSSDSSADRMTRGVSRTINSVRVPFLLVEPNRFPNTGIWRRNGMPSLVVERESLIRPPRATVSPSWIATVVEIFRC